MESPCIRNCTLDEAVGWCIGCGRTLDEITQWAGASEERQREILAGLPARLEARRQRMIGVLSDEGYRALRITAQRGRP